MVFPSLGIARRDCLCKHLRESPAARSLKHTYPEETERLVALQDLPTIDPISISPSGSSYDEIGCFPVGTDVSLEDFQEIVFSQRNLRKLELLDIMKPANLRKYGLSFSEFINT